MTDPKTAAPDDPALREDLTVAPDGRPLSAQPEWRREFPIDWPADECVSRRALMKFMTLTSCAFVAGHAWLAASSAGKPADMPSERLAIARVDELAPGAARTFQYPPGSPPRLLIRLDGTRFVAYDQACTHLSCPVVPQPRLGKIHCPCHNGWFDLETGAPLAGPPRRPLPRVTLEVRDGGVYAPGTTPGGATS